MTKSNQSENRKSFSPNFMYPKSWNLPAIACGGNAEG